MFNSGCAVVKIRHGAFFARLSCFVVLAGMLCGCHYLAKGGRQEITSSPCVALALPTSGPYATVAARIKRGADAALAELKTRGVNTRLVSIDTSKGNWTHLVAQLPESCAVVGGPLGEASYLDARKAGLLDKRMFFPFVPTLTHGDEGKLAWRFFPSPQDQIDALVSCAVDKLNIRSFGAFYPDDSYGRRMTSLLEKSLAERHITLQKATYNARTPGAWSAAIRPLVNPEMREGESTPVPRTAFEALFVPDSWKNMPAVAASLMDNGEDRLVLLGTTLWEQGMKGKTGNNVALGIFPMAWDSAKAPSAIKNGDFWTALGYDFMKFASLMGLTARPGSGVDALEHIRRASGNISALAPISWDNTGIAHQALFIYQVGSSGIAPLNATGFQQRRRAIAEQAALRIQGVGARIENGDQDVSQPVIRGEAEPERREQTQQEDLPTPAPAPAQTRLPTIEAVPHTSYKLSLPVKR